jgi:hypothetical protein
LTIGDSGKEARATRLITERASRRIGQMAFNIALARPRKVRGLQHPIQEYFVHETLASHNNPQIQRTLCHGWPFPRNRPWRTVTAGINGKVPRRDCHGAAG